MKPRYRLKSANMHNYVFEPVGAGLHPAYPGSNYLVSKVTWARWCRGDYP